MGFACHLPKIILPSNSQWSYPKSVFWRLYLALNTPSMANIGKHPIIDTVYGHLCVKRHVPFYNNWSFGLSLRKKTCCQCILSDCINKIIHFDGINTEVILLKDIWIKHMIYTVMYLRVPRKHASQTNTITWHDGVHQYFCAVPLCTIYIYISEILLMQITCMQTALSCCFELFRSTF